MKRKPKTNPMIGEMTMNSATTATVESFTAATPAAEIPAPVSPPIRACDEEVGRPAYQVIRFQPIAPISAESTMNGTISAGTVFRLMILLTVLATRTPNPNAAMKLKKAANTTAFRGERTRVETTVEIAFAESWNPFVKSKTSATPMIRTTSSTDEISIHWVLCQEITSRIVSWLIPKGKRGPDGTLADCGPCSGGDGPAHLAVVPAMRVDRADLAARTPGDADRPAVCDQQVRDRPPHLAREAGHQVPLDSARVRVVGESDPLREPEDVGVDRDPHRSCRTRGRARCSRSCGRPRGGGPGPPCGPAPPRRTRQRAYGPPRSGAGPSRGSTRSA